MGISENLPPFASLKAIHAVQIPVRCPCLPNNQKPFSRRRGTKKPPSCLCLPGAMKPILITLPHKRARKNLPVTTRSFSTREGYGLR